MLWPLLSCLQLSVKITMELCVTGGCSQRWKTEMF